jgi:putative tryptophan/tyrosine transport system substrate-binding protein
MSLQRREFLAVLGGALFPFAAHAQEPGRVYHLGIVVPTTRESIAGFFDELRMAGFVEGQNLTVTGFYSVPGDKSDDAIAAVVKAAPDAILGGPETYARRLRAATQTIPLDCMSEDLVGEGFAASLAKPGGNITGVSLLTPELDGKRQEILIEAVPGVKKIASLAYSAITTKEHLDQLRQSARARGVDMAVFFVAKADQIGPALDAAKAADCEAINFLANPLQVINRGVILETMSRIKLPAIYQWPETAELGGLIGYGPIFDQVYRQRARQIAKIFRGATAAEIPVEQPANFSLTINLKTAKAIGHTIPDELLLRADKVIE